MRRFLLRLRDVSQEASWETIIEQPSIDMALESASKLAKRFAPLMWAEGIEVFFAPIPYEPVPPIWNYAGFCRIQMPTVTIERAEEDVA